MVVQTIPLSFEVPGAGEFPGLGGVSTSISLATQDMWEVGEKDAQALRLTFEFDRVAPIRLAGSHRVDFVRTGPRTWEGVLDERALERGEVRVEWIQGAEPLTLTRVEQAAGSAEDLARPDDLLGAFDDILEKRGPKETASHFWLKLDLATSFEQIQGKLLKEACRRTGVDAALYTGLDAVRVESLRSFLESRWRLRAVLHAARLEPSPFFHEPPFMSSTAEGVFRIIRALALIFFPHPRKRLNLEAFWWVFLRFANGDYRVPGWGGRFNIEPNSAGVASFAELVDVALTGPTNLTTEEYEDGQRMRVVFASILEPYFDVYRAAVANPLKANLYAPANLQKRLDKGRNPRWTRADLHAITERYKYALKGPDLDRRTAWLYDRWGESLAEGLADEADVRRGRGAPGKTR